MNPFYNREIVEKSIVPDKYAKVKELLSRLPEIEELIIRKDQILAKGIDFKEESGIIYWKYSDEDDGAYEPLVNVIQLIESSIEATFESIANMLGMVNSLEQAIQSISSLLGQKVDSSSIGSSNGIAPLNGSGKLSNSYLASNILKFLAVEEIPSHPSPSILYIKGSSLYMRIGDQVINLNPNLDPSNIVTSINGKKGDVTEVIEQSSLVQKTGNSSTSVMSQKAVTLALDKKQSRQFKKVTSESTLIPGNYILDFSDGAFDVTITDEDYGDYAFNVIHNTSKTAVINSGGFKMNGVVRNIPLDRDGYRIELKYLSEDYGYRVVGH